MVKILTLRILVIIARILLLQLKANPHISSSIGSPQLKWEDELDVIDSRARVLFNTFKE